MNVSFTGVQPADGVEDRYYGKEGYSALSAKQKDALKVLHKKRKKGDGKNKKGNSDSKGKGAGAPAAKRLQMSMAKLPKQIISALETQLKKAVNERLESGTLDDSSSDNESVVPVKDPAPDNANHPVLTRQKKKKKKKRLQCMISPIERTITSCDCDSNVAVSVCRFALRIGSVHAITDTQTHLDSHADTCVVGRNALVVQDFERLVDVCGYDPAGPITSSLCTVSAALVYT
jgi:hypothetical protein